MFLENIYITHTEPCIAERDKIRLRAELTNDVTEVMPYLNTVIKNAIFNKYAPLLSFTKEFRLIVIYPKSLTKENKALKTASPFLPRSIKTHGKQSSEY
ncbi:MAG: hypothetical protein K6T65_15700 [Peptococcaceae bacterium]|nr:hypothetical protein [Peptococcaceae bacterium]